MDEKELSKIRGKRVEKGLTQEEVAKRLGLSTNSYRLKETGQTEFKVGELIKLSSILSVTPSYFFE